MNTINVSQGHEDSIGLEVFLKSFLTFDIVKQKKFSLFCYEKTLVKNLNILQLTYELFENKVIIGNSILNLNLLKKKEGISESFHSLIKAEESTKKGDVLVTLPTTKNALKNKDINYTGHTDYFRKKYINHTPVMLFKSENYFLALLTEHIKLSEVEGSISKELVLDKIQVLNSNPFFTFKEFIFSGINPHCGEEGLLGESDSKLEGIIHFLRSKFSPTLFRAPISGDSIFLDLAKSNNLNSCIVCSQHDQGLAPFKALSGLQAVNITLGLPFLRLSPDHGTAFNLYGKDKANYLGTLYTLKLALEKLG